MSSTVSSDCNSNNTGPTNFPQALPEVVGSSVSPNRVLQDTPEILQWLHLPYDDDTSMPQSFLVLCKFVVESTPGVNSPAQVVVLK